MKKKNKIYPILWDEEEQKLVIIDQRKLPNKYEEITVEDIETAETSIKELAIRGAPAIGIFAGYSIFIHIRKAHTKEELIKLFYEGYNILKNTRPTAYNLFYVLDKIKEKFESLIKTDISLQNIKEEILKLAKEIHKEDLELSERIAENSYPLLKEHNQILTHCNAGMLATGGGGTVMAVIKRLYQEKGKKLHIWVDETRPLLQGARLTAWELEQLGIPYTVIVDSLAGYLIKLKKISAIIIGADRIAKNLDVANKVGSYTLSVLAKYHNIPFFVVAPYSTFDPKISSGEEIKIEERDPNEVKMIKDSFITPKEAKALNLAFDIIPHKNISAIITDKGVYIPES